MSRIVIVLLAFVGFQIVAAGIKEPSNFSAPQAASNHGQFIQPPLRIDDALKAADEALNRYTQISSDIHCDAAIHENYRDSCNAELDMISRDVKQAHEEISKYPQTGAPRLAELYDINENLQKILGAISTLSAMDELEDGRNVAPFAKAYNNFVKVDGWFSSEVRHAMQDSDARTAVNDSR